METSTVTDGVGMPIACEGCTIISPPRVLEEERQKKAVHAKNNTKRRRSGIIFYIESDLHIAMLLCGQRSGEAKSAWKGNAKPPRRNTRHTLTFFLRFFCPFTDH